MNLLRYNTKLSMALLSHWWLLLDASLMAIFNSSSRLSCAFFVLSLVISFWNSSIRARVPTFIVITPEISIKDSHYFNKHLKLTSTHFLGSCFSAQCLNFISTVVLNDLFKVWELIFSFYYLVFLIVYPKESACAAGM